MTTDIVNDDGQYDIAFEKVFAPDAADPIRQQISTENTLNFLKTARLKSGVDVGRLRIRLLLEGRRNQQIQVTDLILYDVQSFPALKGTLIQLNKQGGAENQQIAFNLADPLPSARKVDTNGVLGDPYFRNSSISLVDREQVVVITQFNARPGTYTKFRLRINYTIGGQDKQRILDNHGALFEVTSVACDMPNSEFSGYDHAYVAGLTPPQGYGLVQVPDPHRVSVGVPCPKN